MGVRRGGAKEAKIRIGEKGRGGTPFKGMSKRSGKHRCFFCNEAERKKKYIAREIEGGKPRKRKQKQRREKEPKGRKKGDVYRRRQKEKHSGLVGIQKKVTTKPDEEMTSK